MVETAQEIQTRLLEKLQKLQRDNPELPVFIAADSRTETGRICSVCIRETVNTPPDNRLRQGMTFPRNVPHGMDQLRYQRMVLERMNIPVTPLYGESEDHACDRLFADLPWERSICVQVM